LKIITEINQNIPFWSVIKGDHACTDYKKILGEDLIKKPDFLDPRENALRKTYLSETDLEVVITSSGGTQFPTNGLSNPNTVYVDLGTEEMTASTFVDPFTTFANKTILAVIVVLE